MAKRVQKILIDEERIQKRVAELGREITRDYTDKEPLVICVLKGAMIFLADLVRHIDVQLEIDFMAVSSYGSSTETSGAVRILKDLDEAIEDRDILIVEDIIDTGLTLNYLIENLQARNPRSIRICTLLDKPSRRRVDIKPDYCGFTIDDVFVVGYGLDFDQKYRQLPYVAVLEDE